jgi:cholesterol transport system auxiliary component
MIRRRLRAGVVLRLRGRALALAMALPLAGCASGPDTTFDLSAAPFAKAVRAPRGQVAVSEPVATAPADSDRIVVRPTPDTLATIKGAQWAERLPRLVQTRLLQSFENARLLRHVSRPDGRVVAQYSLNTEIRRFDLDLARGEAVVEMSAKLVEEGVGSIAAAKIFSARVTVASEDGPSAAIALDAALSDVMGQIVVWTAGRV